jgi:hypothetical protein
MALIKKLWKLFEEFGCKVIQYIYGVDFPNTGYEEMLEYDLVLHYMRKPLVIYDFAPDLFKIPIFLNSESYLLVLWRT